MDKQIRDGFAAVGADERLLRNTKAMLRRKTFDYGRDVMRVRGARMRMAACLAALALMISGVGVVSVPVSCVDLDVNPSLAVKINALGRVTALEGRNEDGKELAGTVCVVGMPYIEAVQRILISDAFDPYLEQGSPISITVSGVAAVNTDEMLEKIVCSAYSVADAENVFYGQADTETVRAAREADLTVPQYQALLLLRQRDENTTAEAVRALSAAEIWELIGFEPMDEPCN